ncbi:MAG: hypothetical protein JO211_04305, partial [Acidobacteriaceae bacterium]|nr:hypothetical protein [Acidobacteriaceae bacterium]
MRLRLHPLIALALLAVVIAALLFAVHAYRYRFVHSDADLVMRLPAGNTVFFGNVAALRRAGMLALLVGSRREAEPEYQDFVHATHFDYTKDLDAVAGAVENGQIFFLVRGRFDWGRLRAYAQAHGGSCTREVCAMPANTPGRWASFRELQPDVM